MARPKNSTENMSPSELKHMARSVGNLKVMSALTSIPYRSLQDYTRGLYGIPRIVAHKVREAYQRDHEFMTDWRKRFEAQLDRDFPTGIPSD